MSNRYVNTKNTLILIFILFHISAVLYWNLYWNLDWDKNENQDVYNAVRYYIQPLGLWQSWNVFAPPPEVESHILIQGAADGFLANFTPDYQTTPTRINHEKERKWHENMLDAEFSNFRTVYLEYWCRQFELRYDKDFTEATLHLFHVDIPKIDSSDRQEQRFVNKWSIEC